MGGEPHRAGCERRPECCPVCASSLVEPICWAHRGSGLWVVDLRCPECETECALTLDAEAVHAYNVCLFDAEDELTRAVRRFESEWSSGVADEDRRFIEALRADRILPIDF